MKNIEETEHSSESKGNTASEHNFTYARPRDFLKKACNFELHCCFKSLGSKTTHNKTTSESTFGNQHSYTIVQILRCAHFLFFVHSIFETNNFNQRISYFSCQCSHQSNQPLEELRSVWQLQRRCCSTVESLASGDRCVCVCCSRV